MNIQWKLNWMRTVANDLWKQKNLGTAWRFVASQVWSNGLCNYKWWGQKKFCIDYCCPLTKYWNGIQFLSSNSFFFFQIYNFIVTHKASSNRVYFLPFFMHVTKKKCKNRVVVVPVHVAISMHWKPNFQRTDILSKED